MKGTVSVSTPRNLFFLLCLLAILAYGASFAWYMLASFDIINLVRDINIDDAFYYFKIAKNLADGKFSTFDGGITRTNGYHPIWMLLITPFYWILDPQTALFGIKAFEIMLLAGGVVLIAVAVRLAGLPWILLFGVLPALYDRQYLMVGTEAACALLFLGMVFLVSILFSRSPDRYALPMTLIVFILPWVRLEYMVVSLTMAGFLVILSRSRMTEHRPASSPVQSLAPLLGAVAGILTYFIYNGLVFGGIVPVSGAAKLYRSHNVWENEGGYNFWENLNAVSILIGRKIGSGEKGVLLLVLEVFVYILLVWILSRRSSRREDQLLLVFLVCVVSLGLEHLSKIIFSALNTLPSLVAYSDWYYVPAYLMTALIVPTRFFIVIYIITYIIRRFTAIQSIVIQVSRSCVVVAGLIHIGNSSNFTEHWTFVDQKRDLLTIDGPWDTLMSSYAGTLVLNRVLPENSIVGSWDSGIVGYMSRFPLVNLDGLANTYDYLHAVMTNSVTYDSFEIDWFANIRTVEIGKDLFDSHFSLPVFEGKVFGTRGGDGVGRAFWIWPLKQVSMATSNQPPHLPHHGTAYPHTSRSWFWNRMKPHFDLDAPGVGAVVDGRLIQLFARECEAGRENSRLILLLDQERRIIGLSNPWKNRRVSARGRSAGSCMDTTLLPRDAVRPIRMEVLSEGDVSRVFGAAPVVAGSGWEVYLHKKRLVYVNRQCDGDADTTPFFFVHVAPADDSDLPIERRQHGFENLDFDFVTFGHRVGHTCMAVRDLPGYDIARVRTGQYIPGGELLWKGEIRLDVDAGWIAGVVERTEPVVRDGGFDVYLDDNRLLYTGEGCSDEDLAPPFFVHVVPADERDVPARYRQHGVDFLDFQFEARRLPLDFYFGDLPVPGDVECAAVIDLPDYDVARIRTGQYVPGSHRLWEGELEIGNTAR